MTSAIHLLRSQYQKHSKIKCQATFLAVKSSFLVAKLAWAIIAVAQSCTKRKRQDLQRHLVYYLRYFRNSHYLILNWMVPSHLNRLRVGIITLYYFESAPQLPNPALHTQRQRVSQVAAASFRRTLQSWTTQQASFCSKPRCSMVLEDWPTSKGHYFWVSM